MLRVRFDCLWQGVQGPPGENGAPGPIGLTVGGFEGVMSRLETYGNLMYNLINISSF